MVSGKKGLGPMRAGEGGGGTHSRRGIRSAAEISSFPLQSIKCSRWRARNQNQNDRHDAATTHQSVLHGSHRIGEGSKERRHHRASKTSWVDDPFPTLSLRTTGCRRSPFPVRRGRKRWKWLRFPPPVTPGRRIFQPGGDHRPLAAS